MRTSNSQRPSTSGSQKSSSPTGQTQGLAAGKQASVEPPPTEFSDAARMAVQRAKEIAVERGSIVLDTQHLLLALLEPPPTAAARVLQSLSINATALTEELHRISPIKHAQPRSTQTSRGADLAVRSAIKEAVRRGTGPGFVGTEHLLLGLLAVRDGLAASVLETAGVAYGRALGVIDGYRQVPFAPRPASREPHTALAPQEALPPPRFGIGYDVHATDEAKPLILGGVEIECPFGLAGHSDADVLTHAIMDALLGAVAAGDIGMHFPDSDPQFEGASSLSLLDAIVDHLAETGHVVHNVDAVIIAQAPKVAPYIGQMRAALAGVLRVSSEYVSVKATTTEGLGFEGAGAGIAAQAVACVIAARYTGGSELPEASAI